MKSVIFAPESRLEKIGCKCFCNDKISRIIIPRNVTEIQENAFSECDNLEEVVFEKGSRLKTIGKCTFYNCKKLKSIQLPRALERIGAECFEASGLEELVLSVDIKEIDAKTFY